MLMKITDLFINIMRHNYMYSENGTSIFLIFKTIKQVIQGD